MNLSKLSVPIGWRKGYVGDYFSIRNNLRKPISATVRQTMQGQHPYYGPTQVVDYINHYQVEGQCALIGEDGDHFLKYADRSMTQLVKGKFNVNNHAHIVFGASQTIPEWFYYFFQHTSIFPFLTRQGAGRFKLNKAALQQLPVLIPPLAEQKKIASILGECEEAIALTEKLIALKQQRKKGLMQQLLTGKVRFPEFGTSAEMVDTKIGRYPADWQVMKIGDVCTTFSGGTPSRTKDEYYNGDVPWIKSGEINQVHIKKTEENITQLGLANSSSKIVNAPTVLIALYGATAGKVGISHIDAAINQALLAIVPIEDVLSKEFLFFELQNQTPKLLRKLQGGQPNLSAKLVKASFIAIPAIEEQKKIASVLHLCDEEIALLEQKAGALRMQKRGLMQQLLTGKIRVKV